MRKTTKTGVGRNLTRAFGWTFFWALGAFALIALATDAYAGDGAGGLSFDGGLYGGVQGGYAVPDARFSLGGAGLGDLRAAGWRLGGFAGYATRRGDLIGAIEIDGGVATGEGALAAAGTAFRIEPEFSAGLGVLAGAVVGERAVVYGRAGYQALVVEASLAGTEAREVLHGVRLGAGAAVALDDRIAVRAEYVYTFFADKDYPAGAGTLGVDARQGVARLGIVFGF